MEEGEGEEEEEEEGREGRSDGGLAEDEEEKGGREEGEWNGGIKGCSSRSRRRMTRADSI